MSELTRPMQPAAAKIESVVNLQPGTCYTKHGIRVDIDYVKNGEVYVRRWPKGITTQPFFANCIRMPISKFVEQVQGATMEVNDKLTNLTVRNQ